MRFRHYRALQILFAFALCMVAAQTWACSCVADSLQAHYDRADSVFVAKVHSIFDLERERLGVDYAVQRVFKGNPNYAHLTTNNSGASCGEAFSVGAEYLVFPKVDGSVYLCLGNSTLEQANRTNVVSALERFISGQTDSIVEPWVAQKTKKWHKRRRVGCNLFVRLPSSITEWGMFERLNIGAVYDKKTSTHRLPVLTVRVPPPFKLAATLTPGLVVDGKTLSLRENDWSKQNSRALGVEALGTGVLIFVRRLKPDSSVSIGPFEIDYDLIRRSPAWVERLEQMPKQHYINVPMQNLGPGPANFLSCLAELQDRFDFQGKYENRPEAGRH